MCVCLQCNLCHIDFGRCECPLCMQISHPVVTTCVSRNGILIKTRFRNDVLTPGVKFHNEICYKLRGRLVPSFWILIRAFKTVFQRTFYFIPSIHFSHYFFQKLIIKFFTNKKEKNVKSLDNESRRWIM